VKDTLKQKFVENKALTAVIVFFGLMFLGADGIAATVFFMGSTSGFQAEAGTGYGSADLRVGPDSGGSGSFVEVQEGTVRADSESLDEDISSVRDISETFDGWVESSSRNDGEIYTNADLTVRVPSENFQGLVSELQTELDVESYNVRNFRLYTESEEDELDVLNQSLSDYENIRMEIKQMENNAEKLDLLMQLTEKELEIKRKQREYENQLQDKQQRGEYATVKVHLTEKRDIKIVPDDLGQKFKNEINR
jgi:hypothetical protein